MNKKSRTRAKRAVRIRLTFVYTLMIVSVCALVAVLYLFIQGYRFNRYEGQLEQGGLVQFSSTPSDAAIFLDGSQLGIRTQNRLTIAAGTHTITMRKDGYYDWTKKVSVNAGSVVWLHYIRLVPKQLTVDAPLTLHGAASSAVSYDDKKLAVVEDPSAGSYTVVTTDSDTPQKTLVTLPAGSYTTPAVGESQAFELITWAHDNRYLLIKHAYGSKIEWLSVDTANQNTVKNITQLLGVAASAVLYAKDDANTLYVLDNNADIRRANVDQKTLSGPLAQNVESFDMYDSSTLTYVTKPTATNAKRSIAYLTLGAKKARIVAEYDSASGGTVRFAIGSYNGARYLAIANGDTLHVLTGDLSVSDAEKPAAFTSFANVTLAGGAQYIGFSPEERRFVYAQNGSSMVTVDLDDKTTTSHDFTTVQTQAVRWIDRYHFTGNENGGLVMYDYDGTNGHTLLTKSIGNTAVILSNGHYMYALRPLENGAQIARIKLVLN
jgi:hypothetical protein